MADSVGAPVARPRWWAIAGIGAGYLIALALIALWPTTVSRPIDGLLQDLEHQFPGVVAQLEFAANVALFVPAGLLLGVLLPVGRRWLGVVAGAVASLGIELVQGFLLPDRFASLRDIVANTAGTAIGIGIAVGSNLWTRVRSRRQPGLREEGDYR